MLKKVANYVDKWQMLQKEDCVIVGVSGGADSVCLLFVLLELRQEIGFKIVVTHVNHGLRGEEADSDEAYVKKLCAENGLICESYFVNVESIAKNRKQSTEEAGREVRRECFAKTLQKYDGTKIALAHHQNDSAETFLFHLARGTGLKGLGGIAAVSGNVIRPLLCVDRSEIEHYLKMRGISYCTDRTNADDTYTRNRIRNRVIPYMEQNLNSKTVVHINEVMEQIRLIQDFLEEQVEFYWTRCVQTKGEGYVVLESAYRELPEVIQSMLLKRVLACTCGKEKDLEAIHVRALQELFDRQAGRKLDFPYEVEAVRIYEGISLGQKKKDACFEKQEKDFCLQDGEKEFRWGDKQISCKVLQNDKIDENSCEKSNTKWFDCDIIKDNIHFRTRREGDYITIHPDGRTQKLKSYFINEKIPLKDRDHILLVADGNHILWIVGYRLNPIYQMKKNTKHVLEIRIDEGENYGREN